MPLRIALQFLTRLPVPTPDYSADNLRESLYWYAAAGGVIGLVLWLAQSLLLWLLPGDAHRVVGALLLTFWVLVTGALHLDGLADSADAWLGGHGDREKSLRIMKDPQSGPAGVVAVVLLLVLKFALIVYLQEHRQFTYLLLVPVTARSLIPLLFLSTPYVRHDGLGKPFSEGLQAARIWPGIIAAIALGLLTNGLGWLWALLLAALLFYSARRLLLNWLGGTTGDTAGALIEILECGLLIGCLWTA